jgi:hypothetical protein
VGQPGFVSPKPLSFHATRQFLLITAVFERHHSTCLKAKLCEELSLLIVVCVLIAVALFDDASRISANDVELRVTPTSRCAYMAFFVFWNNNEIQTYFSFLNVSYSGAGKNTRH